MQTQGRIRRLRRKSSDSGPDTQTREEKLRLRAGYADSGENAQTQDRIHRLSGKCSDSGPDTQTREEMLRLRAGYADSGGNAQTPGRKLTD